MRRASLAVLALVLSGCGVITFSNGVTHIESAENLDFEGGTHAGSLPSSWQVAQGAQSGTPQDYSFAVDGEERHGGDRSLRIRAERAPGAHGGVYQCISRPSLDRPVVRLRAFIRTDAAGGDGASLWISASDDSFETIAFENMDGRRARDTADWTAHDVEITIPEDRLGDVAELCFGFFADGTGTAWVDDMELEASR